MTLGDMLSHMGVGTKHLSERYSDYAQPSHDQHVFYGYEHSQPSHGHVAYSKHGHGGIHKSNAAMSALTLLAFLFFLHILQQCLRDHMTAMQQPQLMVMTGGRIGEENISKRADVKKVDKSGDISTNDKKQDQTDHNGNDKNTFYDDETFEDKYLMKVITSDKTPKTGTQKYKYNFKSYSNRSSGFPQFVSGSNDYH
ncbi:uncharacterized protein LOC134671530 [Cydia fagiglandana]|uniref:uncharacterized protein LOC134671530 n=1 Tax=Cydia fagiglandana TaxID=1458189 RepID=UPI002FEE0852